MSDNNEQKLSNYAKNVLKSEMGRKLFKVNDLANKLSLNPASLRTKLNRGTFSAGFFINALHALGTKELLIPTEIKDEYDFIEDF